jgi:putative peptide zinc metalloprotease protein
VVFRTTGINMGVGSREKEHDRLLEMARTPVIDPPERIAFASAKGGVGKSTTTLLTTSELGLIRHDRILAVECNPHHGTFRSRVRNYHNRSVRDLLDALNQLDRDEDLTYPMLHRYTTLIDEARLETLTAPHDPTISQALGEEDYRRVFNVLYRYYDLISLDLGTGLLDSGTHYILSRVCDQVVVVVESAVDGADLGLHTLRFLTARRGADWVRERALVVINQVRKDSLVNVQEMEKLFGQIARRCLTVRWDRHLEAGGVFQWDEIAAGTREDFLALAAELAGGFRLGAAPDTDRPGHAPR